MVWFGMEQAHPQLGADQVAVGVDEGLALVGVELARQTAAQNGFLESVMKSLGVGLGVISGKRDEPGVVIDQNTQMRQQRLAADGEGWAGREVHHPQVIDRKSVV